MIRPRVVKSLICFALSLDIGTPTARANSWFRADPDFVKRYSEDVADKTRPTNERIKNLVGLRILLTVFGAYNFDPASRVLKTVRRETGEVGAAADRLLIDLRTASRRPDKRLPNAPVASAPLSPASGEAVRMSDTSSSGHLSVYKIGIVR
jgi:hypothetical protein